MIALCYHRHLGQLLIRNVDDADIAELKAQAEHDDMSLEQKLRTIVAEAARRTEARFEELSRRSLEMTQGSSLDSTAIIRADRDR